MITPLFAISRAHTPPNTNMYVFLFLFTPHASTNVLQTIVLRPNVKEVISRGDDY